MKLLTKKAQKKILASTYTIANLMCVECQDDDLLAWALSELTDVATKTCGKAGARVMRKELMLNLEQERNRRDDDA